MQLAKATATTSLPTQRATSLSRIAAIAAASNAASKFASTFVDFGISAGRVLQTSIKTRQTTSLFTKIPSTASPFLRKLPFQLLKSVPTKTLTVIFFELACRAIINHRQNHKYDIPIALACGSSAVLATYPLHFIHHASRSKQALFVIANVVRQNPTVMYAGLMPAIIANAPVMYTNYAIFKGVRASYEQANPNYKKEARHIAGAIALASVFSKVIGTAMGEPFSLLSRKVATDAIKAHASGQASSISAVQVASGIARKGVTEFWSGFPKKSISTGVAAVVSKQSQHTLKRMGSKRLMPLPVADRIPANNLKLSKSHFSKLSCQL